MALRIGLWKYFGLDIIPFPHLPPVSQEPLEFPSYGSGCVRARAFQEKVDKMLEKGTLELVD